MLCLHFYGNHSILRSYGNTTSYQFHTSNETAIHFVSLIKVAFSTILNTLHSFTFHIMLHIRDLFLNDTFFEFILQIWLINDMLYIFVHKWNNNNAIWKCRFYYSKRRWELNLLRFIELCTRIVFGDWKKIKTWLQACILICNWIEYLIGIEILIKKWNLQ